MDAERVRVRINAAVFDSATTMPGVEVTWAITETSGPTTLEAIGLQ